MKKAISLALALIMLGAIGTTTTAFASEITQTRSSVIPQVLVEENVYNENGNLMHEYIWRDSPSVSIIAESTMTKDGLFRASESEQLDTAEWQHHQEKDGELSHRAAKISPKATSSAWYACSQTDYPAWHYSRARIVKTLGGAILEDSNQVQVNSGVATARTPKDKLYLLDWDFSMRSYWGI